MIYVKALLLIALLFLAITFGTQNSESVVLRYYFNLASIPVPLYLVIYLAIILGVVAGLAVDLYSRVTLKKRLRKLEKTNATLQEELETLKAEAGKHGVEEPETAEPQARQTQVVPTSAQTEFEDDRGTDAESTSPEPDKH